MKAFYIKSTLTKDLTRSFEDIIKESENNPESFIPETMEVDMGLESVDIPERLTEKFKENFQDTKSVLTEEEVMEFLEKNKKNMKQTAVEWLLEVVGKKGLVGLFTREELNQFEELEKENMINFLKSVFQQDGFNYEKAFEQFKNK